MFAIGRQSISSPARSADIQRNGFALCRNIFGAMSQFNSIRIGVCYWQALQAGVRTAKDPNMSWPELSESVSMK